MKANCFPCSLVALGEALEVAAWLPAHFTAFFLTRPTSHPLHRPSLRHPHNLSAAAPSRMVWGRSCSIGRRRLAALLQLQCHVGMLPQWESGTGARRVLETAGCFRSVHSGAGHRPPLSSSLYHLSSLLPLGSGGSISERKKKKKNPL